MKAFVMRVDTAQSITQWYWRPPTNRSGKESLLTRKRSQTSQAADHVVVNHSDEEIGGEPMITKWRKLSSGVGGA